MKLKVLIGELREATHLREQTDFEPINDKEQDALSKCLCSSCPTYARGAPTTQPQEMAYCQHGESNLEVKKNGCLCPSCDVYKENKWIGWYFCITGRGESASKPGETGVQPETPGGETGQGPTGDEEGGEEPTTPEGPPESQEKGTKQAMGGGAA